MFQALICLHNLSKYVKNVLVRTGVRKLHNCSKELISTLVNHGAIQVSLLRKYLNCSFEDAVIIIRRNPNVLFGASNASFESSLSFLVNTLNFEPKILIQNPRLLSLTERTIESRVLYMKDYGFPVYNISVIINLRAHTAKSPDSLISSGILRSDPINHMLAFTNEEITEAVRNRLENSVYMSQPLINTHKSLLVILLTTRLKCSEKEAISLLKKQQFPEFHCFNTVNQMLSVLIDRVKISETTIASCSNILGLFPKVVANYLQHTVIVEEEAMKIISTLPKILSCPVENVAELVQLYRRYFITKEQLEARCAYSVKPRYAKKCLENVENHKELQILKEHPRFLELVLKLPEVETNLEKLKSKGVMAWSIKKFLKYPKELDRELLYVNSRCQGLEAAYLLANCLNKSQGEVKKRLSLHPQHIRVNYFNAQLVVDSLLDKGVSIEQVWNGLPIVLYDCSVVMTSLSELETYPELSPFEEWRSSPYLIRLLIYYLEKNNSFNFTGVYSSAVADDSDMT